MTSAKTASRPEEAERHPTRWGRAIFDDVSIRGRILFSYGVLLGGVVLSVVATLDGINTLHGSFQEFQDVQLRATAILELDRATLELEKNVQIYSYTGNEGVAARAELDLAELFRRIDAVDKLVAAQKGHALIERMRGNAQTFAETFVLAVKERKLRGVLMRKTLPAKKEAVTRALDALERRVGRAKVAPIRETLLRVENALLRYVDEPGLERAALAATLIKTAVTDIRAVVVSDSGDQSAALVTDYGATVQRVAQARRGYLYLVSVVLAGEAMELVYTSRELRKFVLADVQPITDRVELTAQKRRRDEIGVGIAMLVLGLGFAYFLGRTISRPLGELTSAFERLSKGNDVGALSSATRGDEIGVMARAADVFRQKNQLTEELLERARGLTEDLQAHKSTLAEKNAELEQFVYTVSHDLKSPVVTSMGFVGLARMLAKAGRHEDAMSKMDQIEKSNERMIELIDSLLDLSRVTQLGHEVESVDVDAVIGDVFAEFEPTIVELKAVVHADALGKMDTHPTTMRQIFDNLIGNALKYGGPADGGSPTIHVGRIDRPDEVQFFVRDNGPGIDPAYHTKVFELFQRADASKPGTGVGLSIVKKIVTRQGGRIWIESPDSSDKVPAGTTFFFAFPAKPERASHA